MKISAILLAILVSFAALPMLAEAAYAEGGGPWGSSFQGSTGLEGTPDRNPPSTHYDAFYEYSDMGVSTNSRPRPGQGRSDLALQIAVAVVIVLIVLVTVYLYRTEKSPEQALKESAKQPNQ